MKVQAMPATSKVETTITKKNVYKKVTAVHTKLTVAYLFNRCENSSRCAGSANLR